MTVQRQYEAFTLFNVRIVDMRHLWTPSDMYKGKKQERPNYFGGFIVQKTQAQWHLEPALAGLTQALGKLYASNPQIVDWRIEDGDTPNADGKSSEFAKGHWLFNASSSNAPNVELVQANGSLVKLQNKVGVKSGDFCMVGGTAAVSGQNNRAAKLYLNAVVFSSPGEEIVFANSVSGAQLMEDAARQGFRPTGFNGSPGFAAPQGGGFNPGPGNGAPGGFNPGGAPGFTQGGGAHVQTGGFAPSTGQNGPAFGGNAASPFNGGTPPNPFGQR